MNELIKAGARRMTLREVAAATGAAYRTVCAYAKRAGWTEQGKQALLDEKQVTVITEAMKQTHGQGQSATLQENLQSIETDQSRAVRLAVLAEKREVMTAKEIAGVLGCSPETIRQHSQKLGIEPATMVKNGGQAFVFSRQEVDRIVADIKGNQLSVAHIGDRQPDKATLQSYFGGVDTTGSRALQMAKLFEKAMVIANEELAELRARNEAQTGQIEDLSTRLGEAEEWWSVKRVMAETGREYWTLPRLVDTIKRLSLS